MTRYQSHRLLAPYIETIWLFESANGLPVRDAHTIVPNARLKLIIPFRGSQITRIDDRVALYREATITVTGMMNKPVIVETSESHIGILGVEFKTASAYRFLGLPLRELADAIYDIGDVLGKPGRDLERQIAEVSVPQKIRRVEEFLIERLSYSPEDQVIQRAVQAIAARTGRVRIGNLCRELGYSKRYLDMKFADYVGVSPKAVARIVRFQHIYRQWARNVASDKFLQDIYDYYYDQAHFIKEFKQFTGYTPLSTSPQFNKFGRIFYRQ